MARRLHCLSALGPFLTEEFRRHKKVITAVFIAFRRLVHFGRPETNRTTERY
ncbi:MAG: hypothetical protein ACP5MG_12035 [Verrucomicrobiia bacterium]